MEGHSPGSETNMHKTSGPGVAWRKGGIVKGDDTEVRSQVKNFGPCAKSNETIEVY